MLLAMAFGLLVGLPSLRLRADYFAIATIASAEIVRIIAQNAEALTGGNQGLFCYETSASASTTPGTTSRTDHRLAKDLGWSRPGALVRC